MNERLRGLGVVCALALAGCFEVETAEPAMDAGAEPVLGEGDAAALDSAYQPEPSRSPSAAESILVEAADCAVPPVDSSACRGRAEFTQCLHATCDFSGCLPACMPYADCVSTFSETCDARCMPGDTCEVCLTEAANLCWVACAPQLTCGETRAGGECDQLDDCCSNRLADVRRTSCQVRAALSRALGGDAMCAEALSALCPQD